jgi:predicted permease
MRSIVQDISYAARQLRKAPGFAVVAMASLALAIGANTTIFSFANQMLLMRIGVPHPEQLRTMAVTGDENMAVHDTWGSSYPGADGHGLVIESFSLPVYRELRARNKAMEDIFAFKELYGLNVTAAGNAQTARGELVSGNFYSQMQVKPQLGRPILPSDDGAPGTGTVAVLSDAFWHQAFGGSPDVLGKTIGINTIPFTIVGVNPASFTGPGGVASDAPQIFVPLSMISTLHPGVKYNDPLGPDLWWLQLMARAKPGVSTAQAQVALDTALSAAVRGTMALKAKDTMPHLALSDGSRGAEEHERQAFYGKPIYVLLGLGGLVLMLACANIANLMLARAAARQREMGVRMALGAGRARILRQVLTESLLLSALGGAAGLFLGYLGRDIIPRLTSNTWEGAMPSVAFDWRVFGFTAAVTLVTGVFFGTAPALRSTGVAINTALKEGSRSATRRRKAWSGKAIVGFQIALSTLLVMSAAFFVRTIINLNHIDPGFNARNLLLVAVNPPAKLYPSPKDTALEHRMEEVFAALPGVQGVTLANVPLIADSMWGSGFLVEGDQGPRFGKKDMRNNVSLDDVGGDFFSVMKIPILAGRGFTAQDTETSVPVSVINQSLAKLYFPNTDPIGKRFRMGTDGADATWMTIVGVCADTRYNNMRTDPPPLHFDLYRQHSDIGGVTFMVRSPLAAGALLPMMQKAATQIDPDLPLTSVRTQQEQIDADMQQERLFASLTVGFGLLALVLACVGIYGIMAYTVSQRTNEFGIRLALGALRGQIRGMVLREAAWIAGAGVVLGTAATLLLARLVQAMLFGVKPYDPLSLSLSGLLLLLLALLASFVPAQRATLIDPMEAMRNE